MDAAISSTPAAAAALPAPLAVGGAKLATPELLGFYDFANNPKVTHDNVLAAHVQPGRVRKRGHPSLTLTSPSQPSISDRTPRVARCTPAGLFTTL